MDFYILLIYIFLWLVTLLFYIRKKHTIDIGAFIIISYVVYAIAAMITCKDMYGSLWGSQLSLMPLLFLFLLLFIFLRPLFTCHYSFSSLIHSSEKTIKVLSVFTIIFSILPLPDLVDNFQETIMMVIMDSSEGLDRYTDTQELSSSIGSRVNNVGAIVGNSVADFTPFFLFYWLTRPKKNKYIILGLLLACITPGLYSISIGGRGGIVRFLIDIFCAYLMFKPYMSRLWVKKIRKSLITIVVLFTIPLFAITVSRFGEDDSNSMTISYAGQGILNFDKYCFDAGGIRYGDRTMNLLKRVIDPSTPRNFIERRAKYKHMKITDEYFITFAGDFVLDYGPLLTFLIFSLFAYYGTNRLKIDKGQIKLYQLVLLYFISCVCLQGGMSLFTYSDVGGGLKLIVFIIMYNIFRFDYKKQLKA